LGGIGAWLKNLEPATPPPPPTSGSTEARGRGREGALPNGLEERVGQLALSEVEGVEVGIEEPPL